MSDEDRAKVARACKAQLKSLSQEWVPDSLRCQGLEPSERDSNHTLAQDPLEFTTAIAERLEMIAQSLEQKLTVKQDRQLPPLNPNDGAISIYSLGKAGHGCTAELWSDPSLGTEQERE